MSPPIRSLEHDAVALCAAYRFISREKALAFLNEFDVERSRWLAVAEMAAARADERLALQDLAELETQTLEKRLSIFKRTRAVIFGKA